MKQQKQFAELVKQYGLTLQDGRKHIAIVNSKGCKVSSLSHSASDVNAYRQAVRELVRDGLLPESCKRVKF